MSDEDKQIEVTAGPYKGQRLTMPAAEADQAVADGWAIDPFAPVDPDAEPPKEQTDEERTKAAEAAEKALRKLRGEEEEKEGGEQSKPKPPERPATVQRDLRPTDAPTSGYATRQTPKRGE